MNIGEIIQKWVITKIEAKNEFVKVPVTLYCHYY